MKIDDEIIKRVSDHVIMHLDHRLKKDFCYHNVCHSITVVNAVCEIADAMRISRHETDMLIVAAWFHDIGYLWMIEDHEKAGAIYAEDFLRLRNVDEDDIETVRNCILATRYPQQPQNLLEEIICDADLIHVGQKDFFEKTALVREEWQLTRNLSFNEEEWLEMNLEFLRAHSFHTSYGREIFERRKMKNIRKTRKILAMLRYEAIQIYSESTI